MQGLLRRVLALWVRAALRPEDALARLAARTVPICYVLERRSPSDLAVLQNVCLRERLPRPGRRLLPQQLRNLRSWFALTKSVGLWRTRVDRRPPEQLLALIEALRRDPSLDVSLVPAAVYWGRAPSKERSLIRLLLSEDWVIGSRVRRFFTVLFNGRSTTVQLGEPISLRGLLEADADTALTGRRVARQLRNQFARLRTARLGPDLSHRRTIVAEVLRTRAVRAVVAQEVREQDRRKRRATLLEARRYANEIAANYSPVFITFMSLGLRTLWTRLYDGIEFQHVDTLQQVAEGNEIVYVPCHRSHMDYLLLSYAIYQRGYAVPHIAAGLNLNLPIVGRFLRKGGAFFIRRSFRGDALYTAVLMKYLASIMARGHPIEYFIEGGRSRTGRLLQPKTGMLAMTVRSYLREPLRPVMFVPVYFGYERLVEGRTYIGELSGRPKEKESVLGLLRSWRVLRERFGKVYVNLGEPIALTAVLDAHEPAWRSQPFDEDSRAAWVARSVEGLAQSIMRNINAAAAVTPINLIATVLLAMPRQGLPEADLVRQLELYRSLLASCPYSERVTLTSLSGAQMIDYGIALKQIFREAHSLGDIVRMSESAAVLATYFRNNTLHLFALPSLIACVFVSNAQVSSWDIRRLAGRIYPYIAAELFLRWDEKQLPQVIETVLTAMAAHGLIESEPAVDGWTRAAPASAQAMQLSLLAQATVQTIERYYMVVAQLVQAGSGVLDQVTLEERCQLTAQRMTLLYGLNSPEFFDPAMFANFIALLRTRGVIRAGADDKLEFDAVLINVAQDAQFVLSEQLRHSILQIMHA